MKMSGQSGIVYVTIIILSLIKYLQLIVTLLAATL